MYRKKLIFTLILFCASGLAAAQNSADFQLATNLMQQQRYAEALPILKELTGEQPENLLYNTRLIDCLIQLKQYDEGLKIAESLRDEPQFESLINIRIGELYHFKGEKNKAFEVWKKNLEEFPNQLQLYINTANTMIERREYLPAVNVYKEARKYFKNERLFFGDIANAYMRAGEYEQAIEEWLDLLQDNPEQLSFVQRNLLRYNDPILFDITIIELDERLVNIAINDPVYQSFYQLQIWLLQENKLYRRAVAAATAYESSTNSFNYSLFNLGRQLINANEFELAVDAFSYYISNASGEVKWRNMEELSNTYSRWAKFIDDHHLDFRNQKDSLFTLSRSILDDIISQTNYYSRLSSVYLKKAELALDYVFDLESAEESYQKLAGLRDMQNSPELPYLQGRINIAKKEFSLARVNLTKANKLAKIGEMAEKTRYFLALTDFYSGDYEFATIQLKSLGRQNTSYYANDALELRMWLQEGLSADSTGEQLDTFSGAVFLAMNGKRNHSSESFLQLLHMESFTVLKDDAMLFVLSSPAIPDSTKLAELTIFLSGNFHTPRKEELLWEQAKLAEKNEYWVNRKCMVATDCLSKVPAQGYQSSKEIFEELILSYPQGFYAPFARQRLKNNVQENS